MTNFLLFLSKGGTEDKVGATVEDGAEGEAED